MTQVSVIIPAYRADGFIARSVSSVLRQESPDTEIVIVSDDGTDYLRILGERGVPTANIRLVFTGGEGTGPANARNSGLDAACGRIIVSLDADDTLAPGSLRLLVPLAALHGAAYPARRIIDHTTGADLECLDLPLATGPATLEQILTSQVHTFAGIAFDRERVGARWPAGNELWEDVHFFVSCFDDLDAIYHLDLPLYLYHRREGSICTLPGTAQAHLDSAERLIVRLDSGDTLGVRNEASRAIYRRYLASRRRIESAYIEACRQSPDYDYLSFARRNLDLFYRLGRDGT